MEESRIKPSRWYYGLAIVILLIGTTGAVGILVFSLSGLGDDLTQVLVPGASDLTLTETGGYTIYLEHESVMNGRVFSTRERVSGIDCMLINKETGSEVMLSQSSGNTTYSIGGRSGTSVFDFEITQPGIYEFSAAYPEDQSGPQAVFAIGHGFMGKIFLTVFGALGMGGGFGIAALVIGLLTFFKRQAAQTALRAARQKR